MTREGQQVSLKVRKSSDMFGSLAPSEATKAGSASSNRPKARAPIHPSPPPESIKEVDERRESVADSKNNSSTNVLQQAPELPRPSTTDMAGITENGTRGQEGTSSLSISRNLKDSNYLGVPNEDLLGEGQIREQAQLQFEQGTTKTYAAATSLLRDQVNRGNWHHLRET